jgi:hypothetical protein
LTQKYRGQTDHQPAKAVHVVHHPWVQGMLESRGNMPRCCDRQTSP